jgi:hypothetical protein
MLQKHLPIEHIRTVLKKKFLKQETKFPDKTHLLTHEFVDGHLKYQSSNEDSELLLKYIYLYMDSIASHFEEKDQASFLC